MYYKGAPSFTGGALSYNVETGERALKAVKEVLVRENDELLHIEASRGVVDATTNHPFYVVGKGWVAASSDGRASCRERV